MTSAALAQQVSRRLRFGVRALAVVLLAVAAPAFAAPRGALWDVVRACMLNARLLHSPWPCLAVDRRAGFVLIADPRRRTQLLVTPTVRIVGLESPRLQAPDGPNYWREAWNARPALARRAGRPVGPDQMGLAVNSAPGRTQDQLHIHIDCLRPSVRAAVDAELPGVGEGWAGLKTPLRWGHAYRARWLAQDALATTDPFHLLAADPVVGGGMASWTLVLVSAQRADGERGFVLLSHKADVDARDLGAGEELLDHRCAILGAR